VKSSHKLGGVGNGISREREVDMSCDVCSEGTTLLSQSLYEEIFYLLLNDKERGKQKTCI